MGKTITEKILAKASGRESVSPGEYITARPSVVVFIDFASTIRWLIDNDIKVWDPDRVIFTFDHLVPGCGAHHSAIREFAQKQGIQVFDIGRHGNSHHLPAEEGYALPGALYVNFDTQAPTMGALGCVALPGVGDTHVVAALGETWLRVPESVRINLTGRLPRGVTGKDVFMRALQVAGAENLISRVLEFTGPGLESMSVDFRMSMCNGASVVGALTAIINPDEKTVDFVRLRAREPFEPLFSDPDADYAADYGVDLDEVEPLVGAPPDPSNVHPLSELRGLKVDQAYVGSCASGRLDDLELAAEIVRGRKVAPGVRFIVTPITSKVMQEASRRGIIADLAEAGATITTPGCGACWIGNQSPGILSDGEVCITTSVENAPGRMGSKDASVYIANPAVVAASALAGAVIDPREVLAQ